MNNNFYPDEIKVELKKIDSIKETFDTYYRSDWIHLKNEEDFYTIYNLEKNLRCKIENIYPEGQSISYDIRHDLEYNYISKYPTISVFIEEFRKKYVYNLKNIKQVSIKIKKLVSLNNINIWSVNSMIDLYDRQILLIENIEKIFKIIEKTDYFKRENPSIFDKVKQHKVISGIVTICLIILGIISYVNEMSSKIKNIENNLFQSNNKLLKQIGVWEMNNKIFDEKGAKEDIEILLNSKKETKSHMWEVKCKELIDYKEDYIIDTKKYKDKQAQNAIEACSMASELNKDDLLYSYLLAIAYHKNQDYNKSVNQIKSLALKNYTTAQRKLGIMYYFGHLVKKDIEEGKQWMLKAAQNGDKTAQLIFDNKIMFE